AQLPEDSPCSAALTPGGRWNALLDATSTWGNAVELDQISAKDNDRYEDSGINWRLTRGYGRLFEALADGLPIAYGTQATRIDHRGAMLAIETKSRHGPRETRHHRRAERDHCRGAARLRPAAPRQAGGGAWATTRPCRQTVFPLRGRRGRLRALSDRLDPAARDDELSDPADGARAHLLLFRR